MTTKTHDSNAIVDQLFEKLHKAKSELAALDTPRSWITNCSYPLPGVGKVNIVTAQLVPTLEAVVTDLFTRQFVQEKVVAFLGTSSEVKIDGFTIDQWLKDVERRRDHLQRSTKQTLVNELEQRLGKLLSPEQIRERELAAIMSEMDKI